ncbi:MAG: DUF952 domain-containing protein [Parvularcula sp.]
MFQDDHIYRLVPPAIWQQAQADGSIPYAAVDEADGYFHLSAAQQVLETARLHYGAHADLVAVGVLPERLGEALKWEPSRGGALFPHLYGKLQVEDITHLVTLTRAADGTFTAISERAVS